MRRAPQPARSRSTRRTDDVFEADETVIVTLTGATSNGQPLTLDPEATQATGTISNDDDAPTVSVSIAPGIATVAEDGTANLVYTVTLDRASAFATTVNFTLAGTATSGTDYAAITGSIIIAAGATTGTITINPTTDDVFEADETVIVTLTGATSNGQPLTLDPEASQATGTISNDDDAPTVSVSIAPGIATVAEDGTANLVYTVTLDQASAFATTVNFTLDGTATSGTDYAAITGSIVIAAGATTGTITINPTPDDVFEANETVIVTLTGATSNGQPLTLDPEATQATGTISNDDDAPTVSVSIAPGIATVDENGTANLVYTVTLDRPRPSPRRSTSRSTAPPRAAPTTRPSPARSSFRRAPPPARSSSTRRRMMFSRPTRRSSSR